MIDWSTRESVQPTPPEFGISQRTYQPVSRAWLDEGGFWTWAISLWDRGIATVISSPVDHPPQSTYHADPSPSARARGNHNP